MNPPIDLAAAWEHHVARVLSDSEEDGRNPRKLAASDLHSCNFALYERLRGADPLPRTMSTFSAFERGHAYEMRVWEALSAFVAAQGANYPYAISRAPTVTLDGITGHPDFLLSEKATGDVVACIDPTTTASKYADWKYGHALKNAFYAHSIGCDLFCELVICIGYGGNIFDIKAHWFSLDDVPALAEGAATLTWRERVERAMAAKQAVAMATTAPPAKPPIDPQDGTLETWRCEKGYCDTVCPLNKRLDPMPTGKKAS